MNQKIRIKLESFDHNLVDKVDEIYGGITNLPEHYLENFFNYEEFGSAFIDENNLYQGKRAYVGYYN